MENLIEFRKGIDEKIWWRVSEEVTGHESADWTGPYDNVLDAMHDCLAHVQDSLGG